MFKQILIHQARPSYERLFPENDGIFQQDNDPKHTAKANVNYMNSKSWKVMDWPSQSPDLNPIENLWSILDDKLKHRKCQSEDELFEALLAGWNSLDPELLTALADSMPRRCQAVIDNNGYATKY